MDPLVKVEMVEDVLGVDARTLAPRVFVKVTYTVGSHGPFFLSTPKDNFTQEYVDRETTARVATLRGIGAIA